MKIYKIKNKTTGLYSSGGAYVKWSKIGKNWTTIGHLKNHLNMMCDYGKEFIEEYNNAEIVEMETIENWSIPMDRFLKNGSNLK